MSKNLKSKLSFKNFIIVPFIVLPFLLLGIPKIISTINGLKSSNNDVTGVFIPILFLLIILFLLKKQLARLPELSIDEKGITFKSFRHKEAFLWNEIEKIELSGKKQFGTFFNTTMEAITFGLKNNNQKYFWIEQYSNSSQIRIILERAKAILNNDSLNFENLDFEIPLETIENDRLLFEEKEIFNNNHLFSSNGILFYSFIAFNLFMIFQNPELIIKNYDKLLLISFVCIILCTVFSSAMNFFILTEKYLIVKNSVWFWRNDVYKIENIREVIVEMPFRSPITLKITSNNYQINTYKASSLSTSTWKKLIIRLEEKEINVRNEVNFN